MDWANLPRPPPKKKNTSHWRHSGLLQPMRLEDQFGTLVSLGRFQVTGQKPQQDHAAARRWLVTINAAGTNMTSNWPHVLTLIIGSRFNVFICDCHVTPMLLLALPGWKRSRQPPSLQGLLCPPWPCMLGYFRKGKLGTRMPKAHPHRDNDTKYRKLIMRMRALSRL